MFGETNNEKFVICRKFWPFHNSSLIFNTKCKAPHGPSLRLVSYDNREMDSQLSDIRSEESGGRNRGLVILVTSGTSKSCQSWNAFGCSRPPIILMSIVWSLRCIISTVRVLRTTIRCCNRSSRAACKDENSWTREFLHDRRSLKWIIGNISQQPFRLLHKH